MADEKKQFEEDEEYQFSDTPASSQYSGESAKLPSPPASGFRRIGMVSLGLVIVVFAVYKIMGVFFSGPITKKNASQPPMMQTLNQPTPTIQQPTPMEQALPLPSQPTSSTTNQEVESKLAALESASQSNKNDLAQITTNVGAVNRSILTVNEKLTELNATLERLSNEVSFQRAQLDQMKKKVVKRKTGMHKSQPQVQYYLQAVVPGRAWIMGTGGKPITVREGSTIPGHGRVKSIDPHQGTVTTTDGATIKFNPDES